MRKTKRRKSGTSTKRGLVGTLFKGAQRLPAHVSDEPEWYLDGAEVKLTRVFTIVLILHLVAVGGILAFKMIEKASAPSSLVETSSDAKRQEAESAKAAVASDVVEAKPAEVKQAVKKALKVERRNPVILSDPTRKGMSSYRVSAGETLVSIAREQGVSVAELRRLNDLHTGDQLYSGKWLTVPEKVAANEQTVGNTASPVKAVPVSSQPKVLKAKPVGSQASKSTAHASKATKVVKAKPVASKAKSKAKVKTVPVAKKATKAPAATKGATYTVQSGDTLYGIARKTGVKYSTLISLNHLDKPELLKVGQVLKVAAK
ncbi:MAG: LysM peptidoglycan-binding domain-containing protein [Verrucomicrobiales bacterium]|nr:LysM peptidoglycan-binding domain-containing protein [Verrucomicrobiales bacterium]